MDKPGSLRQCCHVNAPLNEPAGMDCSWVAERPAGKHRGPCMIKRILRTIPLVLLAFSLPALMTAASADPVAIKVDLSNKGGKMRIIMSAHQTKAGAVDFNIVNSSKIMLHEFLITPWKGKITALPYSAKDTQVIEEKLPHLAGVEDMKPGAHAILRLPLKPGRYVVFCNQPGHYKAGMVARFTVTRSPRMAGAQ
jgi:uncharacterized cupredoxin-like copper-binding protein